MLEWKQQRVIDADIETVWELFRDRNIQKIMPKVENHVLIEKQENEAGAKHEQTYREGKRLETYIVETLAYEDTENKKRKKIEFNLAKAFGIHLAFTLEQINGQQTLFIYEGTNKGTNFVGRAMMKLASKKSNMEVVRDFLDLVEQEALKSSESSHVNKP